MEEQNIQDFDVRNTQHLRRGKNMKHDNPGEVIKFLTAHEEKKAKDLLDEKQKIEQENVDLDEKLKERVEKAEFNRDETIKSRVKNSQLEKQ